MLWVTGHVLAIGLACLVIFHAPDGSELDVESNAINAVRPANEVFRGHLAEGTNTVIYIPGQTFAVRESLRQVEEKIKQCDMQGG